MTCPVNKNTGGKPNPTSLTLRAIGHLWSQHPGVSLMATFFVATNKWIITRFSFHKNLGKLYFTLWFAYKNTLPTCGLKMSILPI